MHTTLVNKTLPDQCPYILTRCSCTLCTPPPCCLTIYHHTLCPRRASAAYVYLYITTHTQTHTHKQTHTNTCTQHIDQSQELARNLEMLASTKAGEGAGFREGRGWLEKEQGFVTNEEDAFLEERERRIQEGGRWGGGGAVSSGLLGDTWRVKNGAIERTGAQTLRALDRSLFRLE